MSNYRFQYQPVAGPTVRYDDAPHYPRHSTFPHHKHIGMKVFACLPPSIEDILQEIERILDGEPPIIPIE